MVRLAIDHEDRGIERVAGEVIAILLIGEITPIRREAEDLDIGRIGLFAGKGRRGCQQQETEKSRQQQGA